MPLTNPAKPRQTPSRETVFDSAKTFENLVAAYKGMARWRGFSNHHFRGELACLKTHALRFAWRGLQTPRSSPDATRNHRVPCHPDRRRPARDRDRDREGRHNPGRLLLERKREILAGRLYNRTKKAQGGTGANQHKGTPKNNNLLTINGLRPALACLDL